MNILDKIISPSLRKEYSVNLNGTFKIDDCEFAVFYYDGDYAKIPGFPGTPDTLEWIGFTEREIESAILGFRKFAKKFAEDATAVLFDNVGKYYNYSNDFVAIYCEDCIAVLKAPSPVKAGHLFINGFEKNPDLFVPLADNRIAYYDRNNQELICPW